MVITSYQIQNPTSVSSSANLKKISRKFSKAELTFIFFMLLWTLLIPIMIHETFPNFIESIKAQVRANKEVCTLIVLGLYVLAIVAILSYFYPEKSIIVFWAVHLITRILEFLHMIVKIFHKVKKKENR
jgi:hypothetical protein